MSAAYRIATCLIVVIVTALSIAIFPPVSAWTPGQNLSAPPFINIYEWNSGIPVDRFEKSPVIYSETANVTLRLIIRIPYSVYDPIGQGDVMFHGHLTSASYKTSWQNNQTIILSAYGKQELEVTLTNISYGEHNLEANASCVIFPGYGDESYPYYDNAEKSLNFTVARQPTPTPSVPETTLLAILPLLLSLLSVAFVIRHRKTAKT
ncbi:MAG: hypothetical protein ACFCUE_04580 [Candidatus Bathyarchaeia archaeon]|jgi:hypothetical protein